MAESKITPKMMDEVAKILREPFPHGHPRFIPLTLAEMQLHSDKNYDYAKGGDPLGNFNRVANILKQYPGLPMDPPVVAMIYALKQLDAYLWMKAQGHEGKVEGKATRLGDISVYTKLARIMEEEGVNCDSVPAVDGPRS